MNLYTFYKKYFLLNLEDYPNIGGDFPISAFLLILAVGFIITTVIVNYRRAKMTAIITRLTRLEATSEESARTISELRLDTRVIRSLLSKTDGQLAAVVARAGAKAPTYEEFMSKGYKKEKIDFSEARFYISESGRDRAKRILDMGAPTVLNTVLFSILIFAVYICLVLLMPALLSALNDYLGGL